MDVVGAVKGPSVFVTGGIGFIGEAIIMRHSTKFLLYHRINLCIPYKRDLTQQVEDTACVYACVTRAFQTRSLPAGQTALMLIRHVRAWVVEQDPTQFCVS